MTKEEYVAALKENADYALAEDASEEEKTAFEEAKAELKDEGETPAE